MFLIVPEIWVLSDCYSSEIIFLPTVVVEKISCSRTSEAQDIVEIFANDGIYASHL